MSFFAHVHPTTKRRSRCVPGISLDAVMRMRAEPINSARLNFDFNLMQGGTAPSWAHNPALVGSTPTPAPTFEELEVSRKILAAVRKGALK